MAIQLFLAAALALLSTTSATLGAADEAALVQVEVLIADVAKRSRQRRGELAQPARASAASTSSPVAAVQLQSLRQGSSRMAEAEGTIFDLDLNYNFAAANAPKTDPIKVQKSLRLMRGYTGTAQNFSRAAAFVVMRLNSSSAQGFKEVKPLLCGALGPLCEKANTFEREFDHTLDANREGMTGQMEEMAKKQQAKFKSQMHNYISPLMEIRQAVLRADNAEAVCGVIKTKLEELKKYSRGIVALNRNQATGSKAMLEHMQESWKPYVDVSMVREMGGMAAQTANAVELATKRVADSLTDILDHRIDCQSCAASRRLRSLLAGVLLLRLLF